MLPWARYETNTVDNLINGVTLTLRQADAAKDISLPVEVDTEPAVTAVSDFVDSFNELAKFIDTLSEFDSESGQAGLLLGNRNATSILETVRSAVLDTVPGLSNAANRLTAIGVSVNDQGQLEFNETTLQDALNGRTPGIDALDVKRLFALDGESSHASVRFISGSTRTQASVISQLREAFRGIREVAVRLEQTGRTTPLGSGTPDHTLAVG